MPFQPDEVTTDSTYLNMTGLVLAIYIHMYILYVQEQEQERERERERDVCLAHHGLYQI
jgi:hypothetical protein